MPIFFRKVKQLALALFALAFYGYPARKLTVIGVTGTDGKTTTVNLIYHILKMAGEKVSVISTVGAVIGKRKIETGLHTTTPDPFLLQKFLREAVDAGSKYLVLEVSSHGLDQYRTLGCNFYIGVLTNITHEHLDYHQTFRNYLQAKAKLFTSAKIAVLNRIDPSFCKLRKIIKSKSNNIRILDYPHKKLAAKLRQAIKKRFPEPYNFLNVEAAITVAEELGINEEFIARAIKTFPSVPGRMQEIKNRRGFRVIVDFAHTPNGLQNVLTALRKIKTKRARLITVFGCAGERDTAKRPMMGEIATRLADISVFTAEDPRHERVEDIIDAMLKGARKHKSKYMIEPDRKKAIVLAINKLAKKDDIVVICGKGPEKSMAVGDKEMSWSDSAVAAKSLQNLKSF